MNQVKIRLTNHKNVDILIGEGISKQLHLAISDFPEDTNFIIMTEQNIYQHYNQLLDEQFQDFRNNIILCPGGERAKDLKNIEKVYSELIVRGCNKTTCLVAFGGGVIGDIAGFIAATFMRGIKYINIPTSLLAMVDSSIGGKTGLNLSYGKNLVGAIYHPDKIIIDPSLLNTLPMREYYSGMAEVIKYGLILDKELFKKLETNLEQLISNNGISKLLNEIIVKCIQLKISIIEQDENDNHIRNILNFGHTIGHALESYFNYQGLRHGEAVAYGMLYATKLSNLYGNLLDEEANKINRIIQKLELPELKNIEIEPILTFIRNDKKNISNSLNFILLDKIGSATISKNISYDNIKMVLTDYEHISC